LLRYLRDVHGAWDNVQDDAGNYAADLADMANTDRHRRVAEFLRRECSDARAKSCQTLGVPLTATNEEIRQAYLCKAKQLHPDKNQGGASEEEFNAIKRAYDHLTVEHGRGNQTNPAHSLNLMIEVQKESNGDETVDDSSLFKARLIAVLLEYSDKGLDLR